MIFHIPHKKKISILAICIALLGICYLLFPLPWQKHKLVKSTHILECQTGYAVSAPGCDTLYFSTLTGDSCLCCFSNTSNYSLQNQWKVAYTYTGTPLLNYLTTKYCLAINAIEQDSLLSYLHKNAHTLLSLQEKELTRQQKLIEQENQHLAYYMSTHDIMDEGYTQVGLYATNFQQQEKNIQTTLQSLQKIIKTGKTSFFPVQYYLKKTTLSNDSITLHADSCQLLFTTDSISVFQPISNKSTSALNKFIGKCYMWYVQWLFNCNEGRIPFLEGSYIGQTKNQIPHGYGTYETNQQRYEGRWINGTLRYGKRVDSLGIYTGNLNDSLCPSGYGKWYNAEKTSYYTGTWNQGNYNQFGMLINLGNPIQIGWWKQNKYLGEKMIYGSERVYGIDISRYQHQYKTIRKGRKRIRVGGNIDWKNLRITHLGNKHNHNAVGAIDFPVSFCYIKSTQGTRIYSQYYTTDARNARKQGIKVGAYHFMAPSSGKAQANWFLRKTTILKEDLPPVLDVELTSKQIAKMGGKTALYREIQAWLDAVESKTGKKPILYVSQRFIEKYLHGGPEKLLSYQVWIARYGEYRPYVKLLYWQLSPNGRVNGINGDVDIDVFNGNKSQFEQYIQNNFQTGI